MLIIGCGMGTYIRNMSWISEKALWEDVLIKYPGLARPYQQLAVHYREKGDLKTASALYKKALTLKDPRPKQAHALSLNNLALMFQDAGAYARALAHYQDALSAYPEYDYARYNMVLTLINMDLLDEALRNMDYLITKTPFQKDYLNIGGFILIKKKKYADAITYFRKALQLAPGHRGVQVNLGFAFSRLGEYKKAEWFLKMARQTHPKDPLIVLILLENSLRSGDTSGADRYLEKLFRMISIEDAALMLKELPRQAVSLPLSADMLRAAIVKKLNRFVQ